MFNNFGHSFIMRSLITTYILFVILECVIASYCESLEDTYASKKRYVSIQGNLKNVSIYWNNEYSRAASAILAVLLRHVIGYQDVYLHDKPNEALQNNEVILTVTDAIQAPDFLPNLEDRTKIDCLGQASLVIQQYYVYMPQKYRNLKECANITSWSFYDNITTLQDCGFEFTDESGSHPLNKPKLKIYTRKPTNTIEILSPQTVQFESTSDCVEIIDMLAAETKSFIFFDDIWPDSPYVSKLEQPSCNRLAQAYKDDMNTFVIVRFTNSSLLLEYAPSIYQIGNLLFYHDYLKLILDIEKETKSIEEAACEWALGNFNKVNEWRDKITIPNEDNYHILNFFMDIDEDTNLHDKLLKLFSYEYNTQSDDNPNLLNIGVYSYRISDINQIIDIIHEYMTDNQTCQHHTRQKLLGAVVGEMKNISKLIQNVDYINLPIVLYGNDDIDIKSKRNLWLSGGTSFHIALALQYYVLDMKRSRIAVLSDKTAKAKKFFNDLNSLEGIAIRDHSIQTGLSQYEADSLLTELKSEKARVIFINTNYEKAFTILAAAENLEMVKNYVWFVREWEPNNKTFNITPITISYLSGSSKYLEDNDGWKYLRDIMKDKFWPNVDWPVQAPALVDALLTLTKGFEFVFRRKPQARHDVHDELALREFERSILEENILGVTQNLVYDSESHSLKENIVVMEEWFVMKSELLAKYHVYTTDQIVKIEKSGHSYKKYIAISDDTIIDQCIIHNGDKYENICYDLYIFPTIAILLTLIILAFAYKVLSRSMYQTVNR